MDTRTYRRRTDGRTDRTLPSNPSTYILQRGLIIIWSGLSVYCLNGCIIYSIQDTLNVTFIIVNIIINILLMAKLSPCMVQPYAVTHVVHASSRPIRIYSMPSKMFTRELNFWILASRFGLQLSKIKQLHAMAICMATAVYT